MSEKVGGYSRLQLLPVEFLDAVFYISQCDFNLLHLVTFHLCSLFHSYSFATISHNRRHRASVGPHGRDGKVTTCNHRYCIGGDNSTISLRCAMLVLVEEYFSCFSF